MSHRPVTLLESLREPELIVEHVVNIRVSLI